MNVGAFLAGHQPFDRLEPDVLTRLARAVQVEFFPAGTEILEQAGEPSRFLYVVRKGAVEILDGGRLVDVAGEGEVFGDLSVLAGSPPIASVRAAEDTICYLLDRDAATTILGSPTGMGFVQSSLARRMRRVGRREGRAGGMIRVASLIRRPPVSCPPETPVSDAAGTMAREGISSLLVPQDGGWGIVTDRDLRTRVLAAGLPADTPVERVMSSPARSVGEGATVDEVLGFMLEGGFHHAPVVDSDGSPIGMVTDSDLMGLERRSPFALRARLDRAPDQAEAVSAARELPWTVVALVESNLDPVDIGHVIGVTVDALTRRLLALAQAEAGDPPVAWAWLALGSEARHEQALLSDQDHALAYDTDGCSERERAEADAYFAGIAERVTAGLESAGFARCAGNIMAVNPALRRSVEGWRAAFDGWMGDIGSEGSEATSILFDYRRVAGPLEIEPALDEAVRTGATRHPQFVRQLARRALDRDPPTGFVRDFVVESSGEHAGRLDVKEGGIRIVSSLARVHAIRAGRSDKRTIDRLRVAAQAGVIANESALGLEEAYRLLWDVRLEHQAAQVRAGQPPDDFIDPKALGPLARTSLKAAFRLIAGEQHVLAMELGIR
jgi:CBS domain-containing protein